MKKNWSASDIPSLSGKVAIVTGTGGIGFEDAKALAKAGAHVVIAGRNPQKGEAAVNAILASSPAARIEFEELDLADLGSVEDFAGRTIGRLGRLDILINNAGIMMPPERRSSADNLELQFATNYLGHFALTGLFLPLLRRTAGARVVSLSSVAIKSGDPQINFEDLQAERDYDPMRAYAQSKLACLVFALELQRRSDTNGWGVTSIAAHPGVSRTDLLLNGPGRNSMEGFARTYLWFLFQPVARGALPALFAATSGEAEGGCYYGPHALGETRGYPAVAPIPKVARNTQTAARLWAVSESLTGVHFADEAKAA